MVYNWEGNATLQKVYIILADSLNKISKELKFFKVLWAFLWSSVAMFFFGRAYRVHWSYFSWILQTNKILQELI